MQCPGAQDLGQHTRRSTRRRIDHLSGKANASRPALEDRPPAGVSSPQEYALTLHARIRISNSFDGVPKMLPHPHCGRVQAVLTYEFLVTIGHCTTEWCDLRISAT